MPEPTTEKALQGRIYRAIRKEWPNAWVFHAVGGPFQMPGIPDLLVCVEGRLIGIEIKHLKPGESRGHALGRVTPQQHHQIELIKKAGGRAGVALSVQEALDLIVGEKEN